MLDNGHGVDTKGKRSPDGRLLEWEYTRRVAKEVARRLKADGYDAELVVTEDFDIPLTTRANRVNRWCDILGSKNVCLVSIHCNAAGSGSTWMNAQGWEAWTSIGQTQGDKLADCLYDSAEKVLKPLIPDVKIRTDHTDGDRDKESNFTVLQKTKCAAVLTENMFQDNREDVEWLLSNYGFDAIVRLHVEGIREFVKV